jgi:hypothetical protein
MLKVKNDVDIVEVHQRHYLNLSILPTLQVQLALVDGLRFFGAPMATCVE